MTLAALACISQQKQINDLDLTVYLVDDSSTDGTSQAVANAFPQVRLIHGDGGLFWNGGMRLAFSMAMEEGYDAYVWFNDDTILEPDALHRLSECAWAQIAAGKPAIVVGTVRDPVSGVITYGGISRRASGMKIHFACVVPGADCIPCQTMNGNFTLIPDSIARKMGNLDPSFRHQFGDWDYGLRATAAEVPIVVAPGYFGTCSDNPSMGTWRDKASSLRQRWKQLLSPKGTPPKEWLLYTRRHFGWRWPLYYISPILKTITGL